MFYHGTTLANARHILAGGEKNYSVWNCSLDDYLYVWSGKAVKELNELEDSEVKDYIISLAFQSAAITAASGEELQKELIVLEFDFPEADVYEDLSCDNAEEARRVSGLDGVDLELSLKGVYSARHNPRLDPFVLVGIYQKNDYFCADSLDSDMKEAVEALQGLDFYMEELFNYDWKEIDKKMLTSQ